MAIFEFKIVETKRDGYIAWDAIEVATGNRFPVNASAPYAAGTFPEITEYLKNRGIDFQVVHLSSMDSLNGTTWKYIRTNNQVIVHDIPRTIFRLTIG